MGLRQKARLSFARASCLLLLQKKRIVGTCELAPAGYGIQGFTTNHRQGKKQGEIRTSFPFPSNSYKNTQVGPVSGRRKTLSKAQAEPSTWAADEQWMSKGSGQVI